MKNGTRWLLALGIAVAGLIGGAVGEAVATDYTIASHEDDESPDTKEGKAGEKDGKGDDEKKSGDSSDKADSDSSDAGDTDGPGDDEDD